MHKHIYCGFIMTIVKMQDLKTFRETQFSIYHQTVLFSLFLFSFYHSLHSVSKQKRVLIGCILYKLKMYSPKTTINVTLGRCIHSLCCEPIKSIGHTVFWRLQWLCNYLILWFSFLKSYLNNLRVQSCFKSLRHK